MKSITPSTGASPTSQPSQFPNGGAWLRADFHLHTRADKEFSYNSATEADRNAFVGQYVAALQAAQIRVGVITNHNKFDFDEFNALRKRAKAVGIYLLPGVELSVNDGTNGIHVLLVFSEAWIQNGQDHINTFLNATFLGKAPSQYENENGRSNDSLIETLKKLESCQKDFFIAFAHVEQKSGLLSALDGGRLQELAANECFKRHTLGFQKVRTDDLRQKAKHWLQAAYPAEVEGSDCKAIDQVGKGQKVYLKLGDFNFEAVKLALADHTNRVAQTPPAVAHSHISAVRFEGGLLGGERFGLASGLNCLIGIRGSGKSSLLEALRYALDIPFGQKSQDKDYKSKLIPHLLASGGKVVVEAISRQGVAYEVHRILNEQPEVRMGGVAKPGIAIRETILKKPLYFGQKDLSVAGEGFGADLVEKLVGERLRDVRERIASQRQKVLAAIDTLIRLGEQKLADYQTQQKDIEHQLAPYREYGIEGKLQQQLAFDRDISHCQHTQSILAAWGQALAAVLQNHEDDLNNATRYASDINDDFFADYFNAYTLALQGLASVKTVLAQTTELTTTLAQKSTLLAQKKADLKDEFAAIERNFAQQLQSQGASAINTADFKQLAQKQLQVTQMLDALTKQLARADEASAVLVQERSVLNELWLEEFRLIQSDLQGINQSQPALRVKAQFKGDKAAWVALLKDLFRGSGIRESAFVQIAASYTDGMAVYQDLVLASSEAGTKAQTFVDQYGQHLRELLPWQVPNTYQVTYHGKPLPEHSLGQRASAMMLFILSQKDNDVLMIDQPEDDLDNQTLYTDVIRLVRQLKPNMQFIFATHNANIPVLGDAEQVLACNQNGAAMRVQAGSVDAPATQQAIVDIMEGGAEAFNKRKEIYRLWMSHNS